MTTKLSPTLLTPETSLLLILDYQEHVMKDIHSTDLELIELNGRALARASKVFKVPVILSTIGVKLRGDHATAWEDDAFRKAVEKTGRRRLIFAGLWTEVCLLYPVLHAQREGFETYFVVDAVGGSTTMAHDIAIQRMVQAGSQPITVNSLMTEWIRDWGTTPYTEEFVKHLAWYAPEIERVRKRLRAEPFRSEVA
jgi:nicotinamidase-related amidase